MHLVDTTLFFSPTSGGVKRYLTAKHDWLRTHTAHRHSILVPGERRTLVPDGISTVPGMKLPGTFNYRLPLSRSLWREMLLALEPDLIEVGDAFHPAFIAASVARDRNLPLVAFFHSNLVQLLTHRFGRMIEPAVIRYVRSVYDRFDLVLAPSRAMCSYLKRIGVARTALQPLGVDTDVFSPKRRTLDLRRQLGLPEETRVLLYAGRFSEEKHLEVLHGAMKQLGRPYHLLLVGGGRSARLSEQVSMLPYRRDSRELAEYLASADALVHAGTSETFGLVIVEAMACGRPVVGVRSGAVPELVDTQVGELAEPDDAGSMAEAIRRLYARPLEALGAAARERALTRFTWSHSLRLLLANYASVLAGARVLPALQPGLELELSAVEDR